jgi:hypothetical protein
MYDFLKRSGPLLKPFVSGPGCSKLAACMKVTAAYKNHRYSKDIAGG